MINKYIIDARQFFIKVLPPHINKSEINFSISNDSILFGLSAISGIGEKVASDIIMKRLDGLFDGFKDFKTRVEPSKAQIIALVKAGAIPTKDKRQFLIKYLKSMYEPLTFKPVAKAPSYDDLLMKWEIDVEQYRNGLKRYDYNKDKILEVFNKKKEEVFKQQQEIRYQKYIDKNSKYLQNEEFWEFEALQIFINDNPFEQAYSFMSKEFEEVEAGEMCTIVGIVAKVQKKKDKNKKTFAYANIYSSFGLTEAIIWHSQLKEYEDLIVKGKQIAMYCKKDSEEKVIAEKIKPYQQWLADIKRQKGVA